MSLRNEIFLSFIIPLYNCEKYIGRCLDSIITAVQGAKDVEIVIINDGSHDSSETICVQYVCKYPFIRVFTQRNEGASTARNNGLSKAKGKYIWFVDADDTISADNFSSIFNYLKKQSPDIVVFNYFEETQLGLVEMNAITNNTIISSTYYLQNSNRLYLWNKIYSKKIIGYTKFLDGTKNVEDFLFNIEILIKECQLHQLSFNGYVYNTTNIASTSHNQSKRNLLKISSDSFRVHLRIKQLSSEATIDKRNILEDLLYFGIGGHFYSILRFYNCKYLFKAIEYYKEHNLYPLKTTSNRKMNLFILVVNKLWKLRFLIKNKYRF